MTQTQPKHYSNKQLDIKLHKAPLCGPSRHISGSYTTVHYAKHISDLSSERKHWGVPQQPRLTQQLAAARQREKTTTSKVEQKQTLRGQNMVVHLLLPLLFCREKVVLWVNPQYFQLNSA